MTRPLEKTTDFDFMSISVMFSPPLFCPFWPVSAGPVVAPLLVPPGAAAAASAFPAAESLPRGCRAVAPCALLEGAALRGDGGSSVVGAGGAPLPALLCSAAAAACAGRAGAGAADEDEAFPPSSRGSPGTTSTSSDSAGTTTTADGSPPLLLLLLLLLLVAPISSVRPVAPSKGRLAPSPDMALCRRSASSPDMLMVLVFYFVSISPHVATRIQRFDLPTCRLHHNCRQEATAHPTQTTQTT